MPEQILIRTRILVETPSLWLHFNIRTKNNKEASECFQTKTGLDAITLPLYCDLFLFLYVV